MKTRRTLSADFQHQQSSDALSSSNYRKAQDTGYTPSVACPAGNVNESVRVFDRRSKPFTSPASLQDVREHRPQLPIRTTLPRRHPPNRSPQRRRSPRSKERSGRIPAPSPHGPNEMTEPPASKDEPDCLLTAHLDPPITKETLSELDLNRIVSNTQLRHDVNYEAEIMFRPNTYGKRGEEKNQEGNRYFEALALEFGHYISLDSSVSTSPSLSASTPGTTAKRSRSNLANSPRRLPRMITAVRDIVKTLVPLDKWQTVDEQFDVDLRMQELERGIGDMAGLIEWLGRILLGSCSPMRDSTVKDMVVRTQRAISTQDAQELMHAIRDLFGVLETMKLDVANHQIRYLRFYLLDESISYEQNYMLDKIASGWSVSHERRWFEAGYDSPKDHDSFLMFKESVVDMIVSRWEEFPATFVSDIERLHALQQEFRLHLYGTACGYTLTNTLHQLGWTRDPPAWSRVECMRRVWDVVAAQPEDLSLGARQDVVLEIVRTAFKVRHKRPGLPDNEILSFAKGYLYEATNTHTLLHQMIKDRLRNGLLDVVHAEATAIFNMSPLEILNRYDPNPPALLPQRAAGPKPTLLTSIARRTAHVLVLHWRVWAPILYHRIDPAEGATVNTKGVVSAEKEMSERERGPSASAEVVEDEEAEQVEMSDRGRQEVRSSSSASSSGVPTPSPSSSGMLTRSRSAC
ncbi:MAG: hypothetical protein Q9228_006725 [Teloschistes exilis]